MVKLGHIDYNEKVSDTKQIMQFDYLKDYDEKSYCQSVLNCATLDKTNHFVLSNANLMKLLEDHGASYSEWKEDCTRYNDPLEMLSWLGY